jgi:hypothetical protein
VRFSQATVERVEFVATHLRRQDALEVRYSHGVDGYQAVLDSWFCSSLCHCISGDNGDPVGLCGLTPTGAGHLIWMLGTDALLATPSHRRQLLRGGRAWVDGIVADLQRAGSPALLENWVYAKNVDSIRWLRHLGFEIFPPQPIGHSLALFHYFRRTAP